MSTGARPCTALKAKTRILKWTLKLAGCQCNCFSNSVIREELEVSTCRRFREVLVNPVNTDTQIQTSLSRARNNNLQFRARHAGKSTGSYLALFNSSTLRASVTHSYKHFFSNINTSMNTSESSSGFTIFAHRLEQMGTEPPTSHLHLLSHRDVYCLQAFM